MFFTYEFKIEGQTYVKTSKVRQLIHLILARFHSLTAQCKGIMVLLA